MAILQTGLGKRSREVLHSITQAIGQGDYATGSRLPTERELCEQYGVSRSTIRVVISRLVADGLIVVKQRSGMYVQPATTPGLSTSQTISVMYSFNIDILKSVQRHALQHGYLLCVCARESVGWDPAAEQAFLERVLAERHRALLAFCTPTAPRNDELLARLAAEGIRVMHVEHYRPEPPEQNYLLPDYRKAGYVGAVQLMLAGYTHLLFAGFESDWPGGLLLRQGFMEAVSDYRGGFDPATQLFMHPSYTNKQTDERRHGVRAFIRDLPLSTGMLCSCLSIAEDCYELAGEVGRRIPEDMGIIGVPYPDWSGDAAGIDTLEFAWGKALLQAIDYVSQPDWPQIRQWLAPNFVRRGTVRTTVEK